MFDGSWAVSALDANMEDDMKAVVKFAAMPTVEGGKGEAEVITGGSGWGFAVNSKLDESKREVVAVSYTHLDVYKRQDRNMEFPGNPWWRTAFTRL